MRSIYSTIVFVFVWEIRKVYCPLPDPGSLALGRWPRENLTSQSLTGVTSNPCDATRFKGGPQDLQLACHKECLDLKAEISTIYSTFPDYKSTQYLHDKCGTATGGKCSTATESPICWCHAKNESGDHERSTLSNCRSSIQLMQTFTKAMVTTMEAVNLQNQQLTGGAPSPPPPPVPRRARTPHARRANTGLISRCCGLGKRPASPDDDDDIPLRRPGKEPKASSSGKKSPGAPSPKSPDIDDGDICLYTNVEIEGKLMQVVVDTGAAESIIPPKYAKNTVGVETNERIFSVGEEHSFQILGTTTINMIVGRGVSVPLTATVVDRGNLEILLGTDFFVAYSAKINILEGTMELSVGRSKVMLSTQFLNTSSDTEMMNLHRRQYTALLISARVNGIDTRVCVDTGAGATVVNKNIVRTNITPVNAQVSFGGSAPVRWLGVANVNLMFGFNSLDIQAFVPGFTPDVDLLLGNDFIPQYVELIDYEARIVSFKFSLRGGYSLVKRQMFIKEGE